MVDFVLHLLRLLWRHLRDTPSVKNCAYTNQFPQKLRPGLSQDRRTQTGVSLEQIQSSRTSKESHAVIQHPF